VSRENAKRPLTFFTRLLSSNKFMADDESDVEMTAAGYTNSEEEDYIMVVPENVRKLKEKKHQLEAQLQAERKDVRIITAKISDVTKAGFFREKLERDDDETHNIDGIIIRTTRYQSEACHQAFTAKGIIRLNGAEPASLLTDDTNMKVKANSRGVPAISTTVLKRYLVQLGGKSKASLTRSKRNSTIVTRIRSEEDEIDIPMFDFRYT